MRIRFLRLRARSPQPELVCQQVVELVTDYLEGALSRPTGGGSSGTWRAARTAPSTWPRCGRRSGWPGASPPTT